MKTARVLLWGAAAVAVTAVATIAIGASVGASRTTLSPDEVARALANETSTAPNSTAAAKPTPIGPTATAPGTSGGAVFGTTPGTLVARCEGGLTTLVSWSPNPGYRVDEVVRGPVVKASVWFESDTAEDVMVLATCTDETITVWEVAEPDDHGGDNSGSGNSGRGRDHPEDD